MGFQPRIVMFNVNDRLNAETFIRLTLEECRPCSVLRIVLWHWACNCTVELALQLYCGIGDAIVLWHWPCNCTVALGMQLYCGIGLAIVVRHWPCNFTLALAL